MKSLTESILDNNDEQLDRMDRTGVCSAIERWTKFTQNTGYKFRPSDVKEEDGGYVYYANPSFNFNLPCPVKLKFDKSDRYWFQIRLGSRIADKQGIEPGDIFSYDRQTLKDSGIWKVDTLNVEVFRNKEIKMNLLDLDNSIEYDVINMHCHDHLDVEFPTVFRANTIRLFEPSFVRMTGIPSNVKKIEISK